MWETWVRLLTNISSGATILSLLLVFKEQIGRREIVLITLLMTFIAGMAAIDFIRGYRARPRSYEPNDRKIKKYMRDWLSQGGRAAIFSRDLSWVDENEIRDKLEEKARRGELLICLPKTIPLTDELKELGADIIAYDPGDYVPQSRFTIINHGRDDARVAVGSVTNGRHKIREFQSGQHPFFSVANDLIEILRRTSVRKRQR